jgi:hypothetical protein
VLPGRFTIVATGGPLPYDVELHAAVDDGTVVCRKLVVSQQPNGAPVKNAGLRLPIDYLLREAASAIALVDTDGGLGPMSTDEATALHGQLKTPRRRKPVTDERLRQVADAYRAALLHNKRSATVDAARALHMSRSNFDRLRSQAVARGFLKKGTS